MLITLDPKIFRTKNNNKRIQQEAVLSLYTFIHIMDSVILMAIVNYINEHINRDIILPSRSSALEEKLSIFETDQFYLKVKDTCTT